MADPTLLTGLGSVGDLPGPSAILVDDGRIVALDAEALAQGADARRVEVDGGLGAVPGFVELQLNGMDGHDFTTDPAAMWRLGTAPARYGITAFLPTIITSPPGTVDAALTAWRDGTGTAGEPPPLGVHVEGPFIAPSRAGAHDPSLLREPDPAEIDRWLATGALRILTMAPELPGALGAIERVTRAGAVVSVGHTDADAATTVAAIDAGARYATHLFNAMSPMRHRAPGAPGALLADDRVTLGLILDGQHLDPTVAGLVARAAPARVSVVSDAIAALGLPDGLHHLGARQVMVTDGAARLADGTLAGSVAGIDAGMRELARITGSARQAVAAVTSTPARLLGDRERGVLQPGARADIVLLDAGLQVRATFVAGQLAFRATGAALSVADGGR